MSSFFLVILLLLVILFIGLPVAFSLGTTSLLLVFLFGAGAVVLCGGVCRGGIRSGIVRSGLCCTAGEQSQRARQRKQQCNDLFHLEFLL